MSQKTKRSLYFFCILFFSYFSPFFVIHQRLNKVVIPVTICTTCSGFLWLRLLYSFVLPCWKIIASSLLHGLFNMWMGKKNALFGDLIVASVLPLLCRMVCLCSYREETGSQRCIFCQRFVPSSLRASKTGWGDNMSSTGRGFGQSGEQNFDGMGIISLIEQLGTRNSHSFAIFAIMYADFDSRWSTK